MEKAERERERKEEVTREKDRIRKAKRMQLQTFDAPATTNFFRSICGYFLAAKLAIVSSARTAAYHSADRHHRGREGREGGKELKRFCFLLTLVMGSLRRYSGSLVFIMK